MQFFAANLGSCFRNQSLTFNPDFSGAKTSFMALTCTSVPPRPEWIETNRLAIAGSFCGLRKTHWIPVYHLSF